jgi:hypothetical protein
VTGQTAKARGVSPQGQRNAGFAPQRQCSGESKFIDDHVAGALGPAELPITKMANRSGDRQAGPRQLWEVWLTAQVLLYSPGYQQVGKLHWHQTRRLVHTGCRSPRRTDAVQAMISKAFNPISITSPHVDAEWVAVTAGRVLASVEERRSTAARLHPARLLAAVAPPPLR